MPNDESVGCSALLTGFVLLAVLLALAISRLASSLLALSNAVCGGPFVALIAVGSLINQPCHVGHTGRRTNHTLLRGPARRRHHFHYHRTTGTTTGTTTTAATIGTSSSPVQNGLVDDALAMAGLPTYQEAVSGGHWLDLVAPYVAVRDHARLCRVSRRFYRQFAPRLWKDPLQSLRRLGCADADGYRGFVAQAACARAATRQLVASLDFRGLALDDVSWFPAFDGDGDGDGLSLRRLAGLFLATRCLVLDGLPDYDPAALANDPAATTLSPPADGSVPAPLLLSLAGCRRPLPPAFFDVPRWCLLVYLNLSYQPEALRPLFRPGQPAFHGALPNLRILKLRGRRVDDALVARLAEYFARQPLWSLDLSDNKVSDAGVGHLLRFCFGTGQPPAAPPASFAVEGRLAPAVAAASTAPELAYIVESPWSASSAHPARYLADAPGYGASGSHRMAGNEPLRSDDIDAIRDAMVGGVGQPAPDWHGGSSILGVVSRRRPSPGLTHLHLSGNPSFTVHGVDRLFRAAQGRLEHFACAAPSIPPPPPSPTTSSPGFSLTGLLGRSHLFRPVVASNLRSLRMHHSLVTHVPSMTRGRTGRTTVAADDYYAETVLRARADAAFPDQAFVPDHNPRLQSLILTGLPRRSAGPLRDRLLHLLLQAYEQQEAIRLARSTPTARRRGPAMLRGLRHIRLEFVATAAATAHDDDGGGFGGSGSGSGSGNFNDLDAAALLQNASEDAFSFFAGDTWSAPAAAAVPAATETPRPREMTAPTRLPHGPPPPAGFVSGGDVAVNNGCVRDVVAVWHPERAQTVSVPVTVWVGSGIRPAAPGGAGTAVDAYMQNVAHPALRTRIQPASPGQVRAGVPAGACVYNAAWDAIVWTGLGGDGNNAPQGPLPPLHDVVEALRTFRAETRAAYAAYRARGAAETDDAGDADDARPWTMPPHRYWTGTLEVVL